MSEASNKAVFLSYASQDAEAARRICEALRAPGVEVWFDLSELRGGDAWDSRRARSFKFGVLGLELDSNKHCTLFVTVISANTQARRDGCCQLKWKLADDRTHVMSEQCLAA